MSHIPSKAEILQWISDNPTKTSKRDIARAFGIRGAQKIDLKQVFRELEEEGHLTKRKKTYRDPQKLPPVAVLQVAGQTPDGDLTARAMEWEGEGDGPRVLLITRSSDPALGEGDRILARLTEIKGDFDYEGRLIRRIGTNPRHVLGIFRKTPEGGRILPIDKGDGKEWQVGKADTNNAKEGELVEAEQSGPKGRMGLPRARITQVLGDPTAPRAVSLIAIHQHGIPHDFPDEVIAEADAMHPATLGPNREDLTDLPLITIDPADARDHDDAVWAHADDDPKNEGGHIIWVAIADVAHYVTPGTALDAEARKRGNSSYFPDRVVPMLPDRLSGDLCSLHEGVARACIAARMQIDAHGQKRSHSFHRGLMRSIASLNYREVQEAQDGTPNEKCAPLMAEVIAPLYAAYDALVKARAARQPLDLDLPERKVVLNDEGEVTSVNFTDRLDAHKLIEEMMILANVAAAEELTARRSPLLFRVHEEPPAEKLESLRDTAEAAGLTLAKGQVLKTSHLNALLAAAEGTDQDELINLSTLRAMTQAYYSPSNFGHFGLALQAYAHFTSPIRRYSDLIVHRALVTAHNWGDDGLSPGEIERLESTATHISETERRSMMAERDTNDRYLAAFLSERIGGEFSGRVSGIAKFGAFVRLDETGADGLIPMRALGHEYFRLDRDAGTLTGSETGMQIGLGDRVTVKLTEAAPVTGGIALELISIDGQQVKRAGRGGSRSGPKSGPRGRKHASAKRKSDKIKRKVQRRRKP
ncbi:ribonuclease R [Rhodalgimonas zhirmunskyi]|uniref:Ribonuclease R n=1 Tax=Rhodalgimonas zhirmunskyi TaxID=2964767 RepID=A0AAJ1X623_9RHOB|nr:ribonuclease R [Rhodoalgimonas zhirmunskyi]MDQ2095828.1 ribonuclease R [Rhodoalgimonas zhirmunskyi]